MPVYRPAGLVSLAIVFDEGFAQQQETEGGLTVAQGLQAQVGNRQDSAVDGVYAYVALPLDLDLTRMTYRFPDHLKLKLNYLDCPFPGDAIRAAQVMVHMDNVAAVPAGPNDFDAQILTPSEENTRFVGRVDEWMENIDEGVIDIDARSLVGMLMDRQASDTNGKPVSVDTSLPLDLAIKAFLANYPAAAGSLKVQYLDALGDYYDAGDPENPEGPLPAPGKLKPRAHGSKQRQHSIHNSATYWGLISECCINCGYICFVRLDKLVITTNKNAWDSNPPSAPVMLYGQNLEQLRFGRRLARSKPRTVQVFSYNPDLRQTMIGQYPPTAPVVAQPDPMQPQAASTEILRLEAPPMGGSDVIAAQEIVQQIAENAYYATGKNALTGSLSTRDNWSYPAENLGGATPSPDYPNLLDLWPGDPIEVGIRPLGRDEPNGPPASLFAGMSESEIVTYLMEARGFSSRDVAIELARHIKSGSRTRVFRVSSVNFRLNGHDGLELQVGFKDYIQAHDDPNRVVKSGAAKISSTGPT